MRPHLKYTLIILTVALAVFSAWFLFSRYQNRDNVQSGQNEYYTCSMHPEIIRNEPGNCPICGMTLIKKVTNGDSFTDDNVNELLKPTDKYVTGYFEFAKPIDTTFSAEISLPGVIEYDQNSIVNISARVSGRIEKMFVNYKFQKISKGQKLFDIYSPELLTEQQNLIYLLNNDAENTAIIKAGKEKLLLYGMTTAQIQALGASKKTNPIVSIYSPITGVVKGTPSMNENQNTAMGTASGNSDALTIKEGDYVNKGKVVFELINTTSVWAVFNVLQGYGNLIKMNQPISFTTEIDNQHPVKAKINFIENQVRDNEKSNKIRVHLKNNSNYPVGLQLEGTIKTKPVSGLWVQKQSMVSIGSDKVVFVKTVNGFMAKKIKSGSEMNDYVQVLNGLRLQDTIAKNAQYLMDSESFIKAE